MAMEQCLFTINDPLSSPLDCAVFYVPTNTV